MDRVAAEVAVLLPDRYLGVCASEQLVQHEPGMTGANDEHV